MSASATQGGHNKIKSVTVIVINNSVFTNKWQQQQQNTKHKYRRSEMSTSVDITMTII